MCLVILQAKQHVLLKRKHLYNAFNNNPDGCGIAAIEDGKLKVWKGMPNFRSFYNLYREVTDLPSPILLHFRIGTQGDNDTPNCHPFMVYDDICFAHNGVLQMPSHDDLSDTNLYNEFVLRRIPREAFNHEGVWWLISLGSNKSVLVFLFANGQYRIIGEQKGHWHNKNEVFFSNNSYLNDNAFNKYEDYEKSCINCKEELKHSPKEMSYVPLCDKCIESED